MATYEDSKAAAEERALSVECDRASIGQSHHIGSTVCHHHLLLPSRRKIVYGRDCPQFGRKCGKIEDRVISLQGFEMNVPRNEADLIELIANRVEESLSLDYKRAEALTGAKSDLTKEVTKDVSSFANSNGGLLIYGIAEGTKADKHRPVGLSPIDRTAFSKERLEHLISNIQPRIPNVEIVSISLSSDSNHVAFVVSVSASTTAHQCTDKRYYRRYNFEAVAMEDYEIRDVMNRRSLPTIDLQVEIRFSVRKYSSGISGLPHLGREDPTIIPYNHLGFSVRNGGGVVAKHLVVFVEIPPGLLKEDEDGGRYEMRNFQPQPTGEVGLGYVRRGNPQWIPILPTLSLALEEYELPMQWFPADIPDLSIPWSVHCDETPGTAWCRHERYRQRRSRGRIPRMA
jgi:hypothetical protein